MNNKEIENFTEMITNNTTLHEDNKSKINNILMACSYATKKDKEFAQKIQGCVKHFYKEQVKHAFGEDASYMYEISKRGIGTKYKYSCNMDLITAFLDTPSMWGGKNPNTKSFKTILDKNKYFEGLKKEITEEGQEFFNQIKLLQQKYNLINVSKTTQKKIKLPSHLQKYVGETRTELEIKFDDTHLRIGFVQKPTGEYSYGNSKEIFNNRTKNEDLEIKILQVYLKEEINNAIEEANEYVKPHLKEWKAFETEFNQLVAKYAILAVI